MLTLTLLVKTLVDLYIMVLLLRIWMQWMRCDFYNPFSQFIVKITQLVIKPLRRMMPSICPIYTTVFLLTFILTIIKFPLLTLIETHVLIIDPVYFLGGLLALLKAVGELVFWVVMIRSLLSWVSQKRSPMDIVLYQLSEPLMRPIRRILPAIGGIDFSAMLVTLILYALNYLGMNLFPGIWYRL
ncbi:YggT family protein [Candidatus Doolittlea endobia]|uniref:YGGT family protein n=1 Tax=Candidatus Doolittlea endobia TaxID=1778262 RepID=A0A143WT02_9ENTR|nr:YggT family protein [Candidatus Doolittlea endobia]CUX96852.1 YGGT family protein [Candidatus Doolittlea endobia]